MDDEIGLKDWDRFGTYWMFGLRTGRVEGRAAGPAHGFICTHPLPHMDAGEPIAVYALDGVVWFQVGVRRWDLTKSELGGALHPDSPFARFWISGPGAGELSMEYTRAAVDPLNLKDPSFDAADEESCDILLWLSRAWSPTWIANVLALWTRGFGD